MFMAQMNASCNLIIICNLKYDHLMYIAISCLFVQYKTTLMLLFIAPDENIEEIPAMEEEEEELEVDELYEELPEEPVAVRTKAPGQDNSRASKAVSLM